jgi:uncharacterized membrane protein YeaQ/YmgE (transglycosylase-associated protein family)
MGIILFIILGGIAGWLASIIMRTNAQQGLGLNVLVGCVGALIGGFVFNLVGAVGVTGFNAWSLVVAVAGAALLLGVLRFVRYP